jgi:hypothetical protein
VAGDPADPLGPPLKRDFIGYGGASASSKSRDQRHHSYY